MQDSNRPGGSRGERFTDDHGETKDIEHGVDSLGTPEAGAGPEATGSAHPPQPAGAAHHESSGAAPPVRFTSDAGEQTAIERGVALTEEGEQAARGGGETF